MANPGESPARRLLIPETIGDAYRFVYREMGTILRLAWFPVAVLVAIDFAMLAMGPTVVSLVPGNARPYWMPALARDVVAFLVPALAFAMIAVALHRVILFGDRRRGTWALFSVGREELLFVGIAVLAYLLSHSATFIAFWIISIVPPNSTSSTAIALTLTLVIASVYLWVRFLLAYPIAVVERRLDLAASWRLSKGVFWRLFWILVFGTLPVTLAALVLFAAFGFSGVWVALVQGLAPWWFKTQQFWTAWGIFETIGVVLSVLYTAVLVALASYSYKALRGYAWDELLPDTNATAAPDAPAGGTTSAPARSS